MEIDCVGKKVADDQILIDPSLIDRAKIGSTIKLKITVPDDPEELSHSTLMEERMNEKFPSGGGYESDISEALLTIAQQDWKDWANPEEDIYEEYRQYAKKG